MHIYVVLESYLLQSNFHVTNNYLNLQQTYTPPPRIFILSGRKDAGFKPYQGLWGL